jgi:hypothetical protein
VTIATDILGKLSALAASAGRHVDDVVEYWTERAAIREYDGLANRNEAERQAFSDAEYFFTESKR